MCDAESPAWLDGWEVERAENHAALRRNAQENDAAHVAASAAVAEAAARTVERVVALEKLEEAGTREQRRKELLRLKDGTTEYLLRSVDDEPADDAAWYGAPLPLPADWDGPTDFELGVANVFEEAEQLLLSKHKDYGPSNIAAAPGGALNGLRVRIHDKLARINHLIDSGADPQHESLRDSFLDLCNYGVIALMVIDGTWPGNLGSRE